jgi:hypothetical protein
MHACKLNFSLQETELLGTVLNFLHLSWDGQFMWKKLPLPISYGLLEHEKKLRVNFWCSKQFKDGTS